MSVNKQIILGNIGQIEKKSFDWGSVTKFSVATNEKFKKKDGEKVEETTWHNCEAFGAMADNIEKFFKKGDGIYIEGQTKHEKYEKDGIERYSTKIKVQMFSFVPGGSGKNESAPQNNKGATQSPTAPAPTHEPEPEGDGLPFLFFLPIPKKYVTFFG